MINGASSPRVSLARTSLRTRYVGASRSLGVSRSLARSLRSLGSLGVREPRQTDLEFHLEKILNRSDLAPRSSGEEDSRSLKPFRWNPAGNQSRPVELDQQPEASLAWRVGDHPCEA